MTETTASTPDWVMAVASVASLLATIVIAWYGVKTTEYAKATIEEGRKNRRKESIEKQLENIYSPLHEILWRSIEDKSTQRDYVRTQTHVDKPPRNCVLTGEEWHEMRGILEKYGHYIERLWRDAFESYLTDYEGPYVYYDVVWYRFPDSSFLSLRHFVKEEYERLRKDYEQLAR